MTAKPCFAQLLVFFTGRQINLFPTSSSAGDLANKFVHFFEEKIVNIRSNLGTPVIPDFFRTLDTSSLTCRIVNVAPTSNTELSNIDHHEILYFGPASRHPTEAALRFTFTNYPEDCQLVTGIRSFSVFFESCCSIPTT